jgi:glycosyltransferase involved in cell wall biosynthesis
VPAYNEEKLLERTLSAFPMELRKRWNVELIVSDGGSKDGTIEIARTFADVVVLHHEDRRQTIAEGRNAGADVAPLSSLSMETRFQHTGNSFWP